MKVLIEQLSFVNGVKMISRDVYSLTKTDSLTNGSISMKVTQEEWIQCSLTFSSYMISMKIDLDSRHVYGPAGSMFGSARIRFIYF